MSEMDWDDFNRRLVEEFRANGGKVTGRFENMPLVLVTHKGAKSGIERTTPLVCSRDGDDVVIIASKGGAPDNPAWFHNLKANPDVTVEIGAEAYPATAVEAEGDERDRLFAGQVAILPFFADYQAATTRRIPVFRLVRK